ncbi:MAG: tetraacyldisaccharide 4'-kinase [Candidatus Zhuqueibacterota bacterium]
MTIFHHKFFQYALYPFSLVYGLVVWLRNRCYDLGLFKTYRVEQCTVISVGNISVGGTGKTPVIQLLASLIKQRKKKVAVLSRGYGRQSKGTRIVSDGNKILGNARDCGDEPVLLAQRLEGVPVVVEGDRYKGAQFIVEQFSPDVILLDDAFQHRRLHRDFDIALVDARVGFGGEFLLPAGFLREPVSSLKRADLIWLTRTDQSGELTSIIGRIETVTKVAKIESVHEATALVSCSTGEALSLSQLLNKRVLLFSGIGHPDSFELTVAGFKPNLVGHVRFSDHHRYRRSDIDMIVKMGETSEADFIVTTEKDFVKIVDWVQEYPMLYFVAISIKITGGTGLGTSTLRELFIQTSDSEN